MTPEQLKFARHALGLPNEAHRSYRNRFYTSEDDKVWRKMVHQGDALWQAEGNGRGMFYLTLTAARSVLEPGETLDPEDFPLA